MAGRPVVTFCLNSTVDGNYGARQGNMSVENLQKNLESSHGTLRDDGRKRK